jgi:hypothetical protein
MNLKRQTSVVVGLVLAISSAIPAFAAPAAPTGVVVESKSLANTALSAAVVGVSWVPVSNVASYSVAASATDQATVVGSQASCTATLCSSTVSNLKGGLNYQFVVTSVALDTTTTSAAAVSFITKSIPVAPTVSEPVIANSQVVLSWEPSQNIGGLALEGFTITDGNNINQSVTADKTSATISGVTAGASYTFTIKAKNSLGSSAATAFEAVTVAGVPASPLAPTASSSGTSISVSWTAPNDNGSAITSYKVYLVDSAGANVGTEQSVTTTSATLANVAAGTYTVKVVAINNLGNSLPSPLSSSVVVAAGSTANVPVFTPNALANSDVGATQSVTAVAPSGSDVVLVVKSSSSTICSLANGIATAITPGICIIDATTPAIGIYAEGSSSRSFTVKALQTINFAQIQPQTAGTQLELSGIATSGLSVRYSAAGSCSIASGLVSFSSVGTCTITASQPGNTAFSAAQPIARSFNVLAAPLNSGGSAGDSVGGGGGAISIPKPPIVVPPGFAKPVVANYFLSSTSKIGAAKTALTKPLTTKILAVGKKMYVSIGKLKKGSVVKSTLRTFDGKVFVLPSKKITASGTYTSATFRPVKKGNYSLTFMVGTVKKVLNVRVR